MQQVKPELLDGLIQLYPLCKRLLLHTPWPSKEITGTQRLAMLALAGHKSMTMTLLADAIACSREQATRAVAPLVDKGYLQRTYDTENRTRVWVALTAQGRTLIRQEHQAAAEELQMLLDRLSEPERRQLQDALSTIADLLQSE